MSDLLAILKLARAGTAGLVVGAALAGFTVLAGVALMASAGWLFTATAAAGAAAGGLVAVRLLIRAARIGAQDYRRNPHLHRLLGYGALPRPGAALVRLMEIEADLDEQRAAEDAAYSVSRHVEVLTAMMGEAHLLRGTAT